MFIMINNTFRGDKNHQLWLIKDNFHDKSQLIISIVSQLIMIISQSVMIRITINEDKINEETTFRMTTITKKKDQTRLSSLVFIKDLILFLTGFEHFWPSSSSLPPPSFRATEVCVKEGEGRRRNEISNMFKSCFMSSFFPDYYCNYYC